MDGPHPVTVRTRLPHQVMHRVALALGIHHLAEQKLHPAQLVLVERRRRAQRIVEPLQDLLLFERLAVLRLGQGIHREDLPPMPGDGRLGFGDHDGQHIIPLLDGLDHPGQGAEVPGPELVQVLGKLLRGEISQRIEAGALLRRDQGETDLRGGIQPTRLPGDGDEGNKGCPAGSSAASKMQAPLWVPTIRPSRQWGTEAKSTVWLHSLTSRLPLLSSRN